MSEATTTKTSGLAVAGLVLGILAAATSFLPIINNLSFVIALIGGILAAISLVGAIRGKHSSKGLAIAGVVLAVVSFVVVIATQSMYKSAIDTAVEAAKQDSSVVATDQAKKTETAEEAPAKEDDSKGEEAATEAPADEEEKPAEEKPADEEEPAAEEDYSNLAVGDSVELGNGTKITVNSVQTGLVNYDDSLITCINVTYQNDGSKGASFNPYDWKGEDANGAQRHASYYSEGENELNSGTLSPGGNVSGNIYFDDGVVRVLYYSNMFNDTPTAGWKL